MSLSPCPSHHSKENSLVYIGIGTIVFILVVVLIVMLVRRR